MKLHQEISYPDFLVMLLDYYKETGMSDSLLIEYLHDYSKAIYALKQFVVMDDGSFLTWAYLTDENEAAFMRGDVYLFNQDDLSNGHNLWVIDAKCPRPTAPAALKAWWRQYAPRFDRCKCMFLNNKGQDFREVVFVKGDQKS